MTARCHTSSRAALHWSVGAAACFIFGKVALELASFGPLASHMATHLLLMNAVAPLLALAVVAGGWRKDSLATGRALALATLVQLLLLWAWHAPAAVGAARHTPAIHALMLLSLSVSAWWFWLAVICDRGAFRWRALFALLVTGKLFCLLGVLLVFAPRLLYGDSAPGHAWQMPATADALADQHLAGLLMLVVCPLTYVLAAVVIAAQWLRDLARTNAAFSDSRNVTARSQ
jgi:putative membrane protein